MFWPLLLSQDRLPMPIAAAIGGGAAISGIGSIIGGQTAASGQQQAAQTEAAAQQAAVAAEQAMFNTTQSDLAPFMQFAYPAINEIQTEMYTPGSYSGVPGLSLGAIPNITDPSQLPGYQFSLQQGENAVRNAASAQGQGGSSGPLWKSLTGYAEGLASSNYGQFLQNYWTNQQNRYNMLYNQVLTGQASAANTGQAATTTGGNIASSTLSGAAGIANAQAAAATAAGAGFTGAGSSIGNALTTAALLGNSGNTIGNPSSGFYALNNPSNPSDVGGPA